jgi:hypothetical protein
MLPGVCPDFADVRIASPQMQRIAGRSGEPSKAQRPSWLTKTRLKQEKEKH